MNATKKRSETKENSSSGNRERSNPYSERDGGDSDAREAGSTMVPTGFKAVGDSVPEPQSADAHRYH